MPETKRPSRVEQRDSEQENEIGEAEGRLCCNFAQELSVIGQSTPVAKAGLDVMLGDVPVAKSLIDHSVQSSWRDRRQRPLKLPSHRNCEWTRISLGGFQTELARLYKLRMETAPGVRTGTRGK